MIEKILIRMPAELKDVIKAEARRIGVSLNALVLQIIWQWAQNRNTPE